jgi:DNA-binding transcriptional regulator YdaS (Cro superfamily)|tara:strand:+ start:143 stop:352 length:210 start_codon:yes stop_codon:yes gene_type:complete
MNDALLDSMIAHTGAKNYSDLARKLGVHRSLVSHWRSGAKQPQASMAKTIELATGGKIPRAVIRPDVFL